MKSLVYGGVEKEIRTRLWLMPQETQICPKITITGPAAVVQPDEPFAFTINIQYGEETNIAPKIVWTVRRGKILGGQGTTTLVVSQNSEEISLSAVATAKISNLPNGCADVKVSETFICSDCYGNKPIFVDGFSNVTEAELKEKIIEFAVKVDEKPGSTGYIINYGSAKNIAKRERAIRDLIGKERLFHYGRLVLVSGGVEKEIRTRFWIVPVGADPTGID